MSFTSTDRQGYVTQFGVLHPDRGYRFVNRRFGRYLFDYIKSGLGYIESDGRMIEVEAGDLVFVAKGSVVTYGADPDQPYEKLWIGADGPALDALVDCYLGDKSVIVRKQTSIEPFLTLAEHLGDELRTMAILLELVMTLSDRVERPGDEQNERSRLREYIDSHIGENLSLDAMATHFHISKRHLIRVFKSNFGETPGIFHARLRMQAARDYLADTSLTVGEIASALGFCDQSFFSATFKKQVGIYPTAWRQNYRTSTAEPSPKE